ncbi:hypothetical protein [Solilutibacter tolerans]|uniref:Uncharacterized protein n=1 Tax=Solilutibacter tolerans TaxID=1604334 RepID=A0A1N6Y2L9_9GAMM|nr:hypothetical protein [Lysobacter tolerans]SIR08709.1 hypothetical protein SAMN05421546_2353 [Lysobacter tolerans]
MKSIRTLLLSGVSLAALAAPAAAQLVPAGRQAELTVEYEYVSDGARKDKYDSQEWQVRRLAVVSLTLQAQKPTSLPALHKVEAAQQKDIAQRQAAMDRAAKTMQPTMADMMKIAERCGDDEACMERAVTSYASANRGKLLDTKAAVAGDAAIVAREGAARYQTWIPVGAQRGRFDVSERVRMVDADPICRSHANQRCRREQVRMGSGPIPLPPGVNAKGRKPVGSSVFEVDSGAKDIILLLPEPLMPLTVKQTVSTDHPGQQSGESEHVFRFPAAGALKSHTPLQVALKGGRLEQSGTLTIKVKGAQGNPRTLEATAPENGTLTVRWHVRPL